MKGKGILIGLLLLGALMVGACTETQYVQVPTAVVPVGDGVYSFHPDPSTTLTAFSDVTFRTRSLQQNFPVTPILWADPNQGGFQTFVMNYVSDSIYSFTLSGVLTNMDIAVNYEDTVFGEKLYDQTGLKSSYPDQLVTNAVSADGVNWVQLQTIQGDDLVFMLDEFGNFVIPRCDLTITYTPSEPLGRAPELFLEWYFDNSIQRYPYTLIPLLNGDWQVVITGVPAGQYELNLGLNRRPFDMAVSPAVPGSIDGEIRIGTGVTLPITDRIDYVWQVSTNPFANEEIVERSNLLVRISHQDCSASGVPGGQTIVVGVR